MRAALADAPRGVSPTRIGIYSATGPSRYDLATLGPKMADLDGTRPLWEGGLADLDPFALLKLMSCNVLAVLGMALPAEGASEHFCDDALGGLHALEAAREAIATGRIDHAVVIAFDDLAGDHARAELSSSDRSGDARQVAAIHLSASPENALLALGAIGIRRHEEPGPVGGAAGLTVVAEAAASIREPTHLTIDVDRGFATIPLLPIQSGSASP